MSQQPATTVRLPILAMVAGLMLGVFVIAPGGFAEKAHAVLHGLCAQRPSHTLFLGGTALPFDSRMTGIYGGFLITFIYLAVRGRARAVLLPPRSVLVILIAFVVAIGIDGVNAFLLDIRLPTLYTPDNLIRLVTGLLFGVTLATLLCFLVATTVWSTGISRTPAIRDLRELLVILLLLVPFGVIVRSGIGWFYTPVAITLMLSAVTVITILVFCAWLLVSGRDRRYPALAEAQRPLSLSMVAAVAFMLAIAGFRIWLEQRFGLRTLS